MTRTVLDNALLLQTVAGTDNIDDRSFSVPPPEGIPQYHNILSSLERPQDLSGFKIGILKESLEVAVLDSRVKELFLTAAEGLRKAGATISEVSIPLHPKGSAIWTGISKAGGYLTKLYGAPGHRSHNMVCIWMDMAFSELHPLKQPPYAPTAV